MFVKSLVVILIVSQACALVNCDVLLMYGASGKINIRQAYTAVFVKQIAISKYDQLLVAYHYKQDLIFYAYDKKLYRIHLVDDNGDRRVSSKGDLFADQNADHIENLVVDGKLGGINGIHVDEVNNKLYVMSYREVFQLDLDGKNPKSVFKHPNYMRGLFYDADMLYFASESGSKDAVHRYDIKAGTTHMLTDPSNENILDLTVDRKHNKLLFKQGNLIRVINTNSSKSSYPVKNPRTILANSQYLSAYGLNAMAADGRVAIWVSSNQLYAGIISSAYTFIPKKHIYKYGSKGYSFRPYNMRMFYHTPTSSTKPTLPPSYNCIKLDN